MQRAKRNGRGSSKKVNSEPGQSGRTGQFLRHGHREDRKAICLAPGPGWQDTERLPTWAAGETTTVHSPRLQPLNRRACNLKRKTRGGQTASLHTVMLGDCSCPGRGPSAHTHLGYLLLESPFCVWLRTTISLKQNMSSGLIQVASPNLTSLPLGR